MYDFATSRLRGLRLRLRYYQFFVKRKQKNTVFISDQSRIFDDYIVDLKNKKYRKAVIIGNAPNIKDLNHNKYKHDLHDETVLTIGLNQTYEIHQTEILLWGDLVVMQRLKGKNKLFKTTFLHAAQLVKLTRDNLVYWKKNKSFKHYRQKGLFKSRTILVSAFHLCYLLDIKNIELYGISLDNRSHFYDKNNNLEAQKSFEYLSPMDLENKYLGYTAQKITHEIIDYLASIGFKLRYGGNSDFLNGILGIQELLTDD